MKKIHTYLYSAALFCGVCCSFSAEAQLAIDPYPLVESEVSEPFAPLESVRTEVPSQAALDDGLDIVETVDQDTEAFPVYVAPDFEKPQKFEKPRVVTTKKIEPIYKFSPENYEQAASLPLPIVPSPSRISNEWTAFEGANLQDVMRHWSKRSDVEVIWNSYADYEVRGNLDMTGSFEDAVQALLSQYNMDYIRPIGNLHIDSVDGQKTLVVLTYQGT